MNIYTNGIFITMNRSRQIITDGSIVIIGAKIVDIDKTLKIQEKYKSREPKWIDLKGMIVIPGLINTHIHQAQSILRGAADDMDLMEWLFKRIWTLQGTMTAADGKTSSQLSILEMLKSGTTTFLETMIASRYGFDGIAENVADSGIRGALSKIVMEIANYGDEDSGMFSGMAEDREESFQEALAMHEKWHGKADGRIHVWFGPRPPGGCTKDLYREMMMEARARKMRVTVHLAEVKEDVAYLQSNFNQNSVEFIESVNMIGPDVLLANSAILSSEEIARLAETKTPVVHNPLCNTRMGSIIAPVPEMLEKGVVVSLGTEGGSGNNVNDMFRTMRWGSYIHKIDGHPKATPAEVALEMATINGAKALGLENEIGSLEKGKCADFVAIDINKPHLTPSPNPVSTVVCAANGGDVHTVVINGEEIVSAGEIKTMDEEKIMADARQKSEKLYDQTGLRPKSYWPVV